MLGSIFRKYPESTQLGYWGTPTSTIDWCEENYVVSSFVAEWSNTVTNSAFVALALYVTWSAFYQKLEKRFILIGLGLGTVGVGSWLFHMTLRYEYQLLDELPMIYATCIPAWSIFSEKRQSSQTGLLTNSSFIKQTVIGVLVFGAAAILTIVYLLYRDPTIHQAAYAVLNVIVVFSAGGMAAKYVHDPLAKRNLRNTMALSISIFLLGYFLWQLDVHFCSFWIFVRRNFLHLPLGIFLELHSWWHLLTGSGVYFYIVHLEYLRVLTHGHSQDYTLCWRWKVFPEVIHCSHTVNTKFSLEFMGPYHIPESSIKLDRAKSE